MASSLTVSSMWFPCFLLTRTGFIHFPSHNTFHLSSQHENPDPASFAAFISSSFFVLYYSRIVSRILWNSRAVWFSHSKRLWSRPSPHRRRMKLFCCFFCELRHVGEGGKIYFLLFRQHTKRGGRRTRRRKGAEAGRPHMLLEEKCLCFVLSFISTATCYQYVKYFRKNFISTQFVTFFLAAQFKCPRFRDIDKQPVVGFFSLPCSIN